MDAFFDDYVPNQQLTFSPDDRLIVFPKATQVINDALVTGLVDVVHASPSPLTFNSFNSKFDTVLIRKPGAPAMLSYNMSSKQQS